MQRFLLVAALFAVVLSSRPLNAMDIVMFDRLTVQDRREFILYLAKNAQRVLIEQGRRDLAVRVEHLFDQVDHWSPGEAQLRTNLSRMQRDLAQLQIVGFRPWIGQIEDAFVQTLVENEISVPNRFPRRFAETLREKPFWPKRPLMMMGNSGVH
jgi:hypothetical protein